MKYSIIIPTMYFHNEQLTDMLSVYNSIKSVGEILIINNNGKKAVNFDFDKVKTIGDGNNMYVNPSWAFGVENAKYDNIILANDDITIDFYLDRLLENVGHLLNNDRVFGPSQYCYEKFGRPTMEIKLKPSDTGSKFRMNYGFGTFMIMKKEVFQKTIIPNDFLVWYGDHILYLYNNPWEFRGIEIVTGMRGTTTKINLDGFAEREKAAFEKIRRQWKKQ